MLHLYFQDHLLHQLLAVAVEDIINPLFPVV
jgi:hypothetical protein